MCIFFSHLDYTQLSPVPSEEFPDVFKFKLSVVQLLYLFMEASLMLKCCNGNEMNIMLPDEMPAEFSTMEGQKLYVKLFYTATNFLNLKAIFNVIKCTEFTSTLLKYYCKKGTKRKSDKSSILSKDDSLSEDDDEINKFISLLKTLLTTAQQQRCPSINNKVSLAELERAVNILHNAVAGNIFRSAESKNKEGNRLVDLFLQRFL